MSVARALFIFLMLVISSFAAVVEAGDWASIDNAWNASDAAAARCAEPGTQAVYACSGSVVKAVLADATAVFYKPDGKVVTCPAVAAAKMGAECVQMLIPNYCTSQVSCEPAGTAIANATASTTNSSSAQGAQGAVNATNASAAMPQAQAAPAMSGHDVRTEMVIPAPAPAASDFSMDGLAAVVFLLGAVSVGVLFAMFKNSISE